MCSDISWIPSYVCISVCLWILTSMSCLCSYKIFFFCPSSLSVRAVCFGSPNNNMGMKTIFFRWSPSNDQLSFSITSSPEVLDKSPLRFSTTPLALPAGLNMHVLGGGCLARNTYIVYGIVGGGASCKMLMLRSLITLLNPGLHNISSGLSM